MGLLWNWWAVPGVVALALAWGLAAYIAIAAPPRPESRLLALILATDAAETAIAGGVIFLFTNPHDVFAAHVVGAASLAASLFLYPLFIGRTLDSPLARPFRTRAGRIILGALAVLAPAFVILNPERFVGAPYRPSFAPWNTTYADLGNVLLQLVALVALFALVAAVAAIRSAPRGSAARSRAWAFAIAFGGKDLVVVVTDSLYGVIRPIPFWGDFIYNPAYCVGLITYVATLAYVGLRWQLFDLDLRVKAGVRRGAVVATFVAGYFVASQVAGLVLAPVAGPAAGLIVVGALALAIGPVHRGAERLTTFLFPRADAEDQLNARKIEVYRAAVESALSTSGVLSEKAARDLEALRRELGLTERDHAVVEHTTRALLGGAGAQVGPYRLVREVGRGASGEVWLARDDAAGRDVALKRLAGDRFRDAVAGDAAEREARAASIVRHPNVVRVLGLERAGGHAYLAMEFVAGGSLQAAIDARGSLPEREALALARDVLAGLSEVHARALVHRDVKPSNVLLDDSGAPGAGPRAKLGDFGIAREVVSGDTAGLTRSAGAGTVAFMAPEQARGLVATPASDVYAAGATLYAMLAGRPPIPVDGLSDHAARLRVSAEAPDLPLAAASVETNAWLARALAKSAAERWPTAAEALAALPSHEPRPQETPARARPSRSGGANG